MKTTTISMLAFLLITLGVSATTFYLREEPSQQTYGPFEFQEGQRVNIGTTVYTLRIDCPPATAGSTTATEAGPVILPSVVFNNTPLAQCIEGLKTLVQQQKGTANIILKGQESQNQSVDIFSYRQTVYVTLDLHNVTLQQALDSLCEQSGASWTTDPDGMIVITPPAKPAPHPSKTPGRDL